MDPVQQAAMHEAVETAFRSDRPAGGVEAAGRGFARIFDELVGGANQAQAEASRAVEGLLTGEVKDVHEVMVAVNKAELSFRFLVEVRNKLTDAYKELMNHVR